jgi:type VI secretion system protein ImpK
MNESTANLVYPVLTYGVQLRNRLDRGESPDFEVEQGHLLSLLQSEGEGGRLADYRGDGVFLGIRFALACWLDEIFIHELESPWEKRWNERKLETTLFGTTDRFWKFWEQAERARVRPGGDAIEAYFLCVMLGFRGQYIEEPDMLREWTEAIRAQVSRAVAQKWSPPPALDPTTHVPPRRGRDRLRKMILIGSVSLLSLIIAIITSMRLSQ